MAPHHAVRGQDVQLEAAAERAAMLAQEERDRRAEEAVAGPGRRSDGQWVPIPRPRPHWSRPKPPQE